MQQFKLKSPSFAGTELKYPEAIRETPVRYFYSKHDKKIIKRSYR